MLSKMGSRLASGISEGGGGGGVSGVVCIGSVVGGGVDGDDESDVGESKVHNAKTPPHPNLALP